MPENIPFIRIFISSPGDVNDERKIALYVVEQLPYRPTFREKVAFRVVAWDKPGAGTPMRAKLTPQDAINKGLPRPSECDIVIVLFWSRMGTPFTHTDGVEYKSGTHWELLDALEGECPETVIYRRTSEPDIKLKDPDYDDKVAQYRKVEAFFESDLFYDTDGKIKRGINMYETPDDFRQAFEIDLEVLVLDILNRVEGKGATDITKPADSENISTITAVDWPEDKSPFPGLGAFTEGDAPIFFGRGRETDALVRQLTDSRFVAVVGASGSGKSSLVGAGLIPRLKANSVEGSADWLYARFTPGTGNNPFEALMTSLMDTVPSLAVDDPFERDEKIEERAQRLHDKPERLAGIIDHALKDADPHVELLLFIDQFEELFTLADATYAEPFAAMLASAATCERLRVVVTMRHDFYPSAVEVADLAELLQKGSYPLAAPRRDALRQMIERPAERAGLQLETGLVERILDDTGDKSGNLALMAYALDELYKLSGDGHITHADYDKLGGVQGAIGTRAEQVYAMLPGDENDKAAWMQRVFHELVAVDERGTATRRRVPTGRIAEDDRGRVTAFVEARLLTTDVADGTPVLEVAHEALFRSWERLAVWVAEAQEDLILLRQLRIAAAMWEANNRSRDFLWLGDRGREAQAMIARLTPDLNETERAFARPEAEHLLDEIADINTLHPRRSEISTRLHLLGDPRPGVGLREDGLPDIVWLPVDGSLEPVTIKTDEDEIGPVVIEPFFIAQYLTTYEQFQVFLDHPDGFENPAWWRDMPEEYQKQPVSDARQPYTNYPRDSVSWYQAVSYARWLDAQLRNAGLLPDTSLQVRLPTEWEWQWAAMAGAELREYPWGKWDGRRCNTNEAGISRTTAVGMYPHGQAECGALDMSGNLREWCLNKTNPPEVVQVDESEARRVLRGGSWGIVQYAARAACRSRYGPHSRSLYYGFRLVSAPSLKQP